MDEFEMLVNKAKKYNLLPKKILVDEIKNDIYTKIIDLQSDNVLKLRDAFYGQGKIFEENLSEKYYFGSVEVGGLGKISALILARLVDGKVKIVSYAKEGIINQHIARKAIEKYAERLNK